MAIILFGGGDGGGLRIGPNGIEPIPPFDPAIRLQLRAASLLLRAQRSLNTTGLEGETRHQLAPLINQLTNLAVGQVEHVAGPLEGNDSLVYQDEDGGFSCGSTGKPPIPFPWPPGPSAMLETLVQRGVVDAGVVEFVRGAVQKQADLGALFRDPAKEGGRLGMQVTPQVAGALKMLSPEGAAAVRDPVDREIIEFFHRTATDGRFVAEWATQPARVARDLGVQISREAVDRLTTVSTGRGPGAVMSPIVVAVAVGITITLVTRTSDFRIPAIDRSGVAKF